MGLRSWIRQHLDTGDGHIRTGDLIAFVDEELSVRRRRRVQKHLEGCPACSVTLRQLRAPLPLFDTIDPALVTAGRERLLAAMVAHREVLRAPPALGQLMAAEVGVCLGARAAGLIGDLTRAERDDRRIVAAVEPLLAAFLGSRTVAALRDDCLERP